MSTTRIYLVEHQIGDVRERRLVKAPNQAQAVAHVVRSRVKVDVASQEDLVALVSAGTKVESVNEQQAA